MSDKNSKRARQLARKVAVNMPPGSATALYRQFQKLMRKGVPSRQLEEHMMKQLEAQKTSQSV